MVEGFDWVGPALGGPYLKEGTIMGLPDDAKNAADGDTGEKAADAGIDKTEKTVCEKTGGGHDEQIDKAGRATCLKPQGTDNLYYVK